MSPGDIAWAALGGAWLCWLAVTSLARVPGTARFLRSLLGSWLGRSVALAAWGAVGWHLFCQHP